MDLRAHPRGKRESKPGADESQEQLPPRGSARGAGARPAGGRLRADQAGYASALSPAGRGGAAPPLVSRGHGSGRQGTPPPASAPIRTSLANGAGPRGRMLAGALDVAGRNQQERAPLRPGGGPGCRRKQRCCGFGLPSYFFKAVERALEPGVESQRRMSSTMRKTPPRIRMKWVFSRC